MQVVAQFGQQGRHAANEEGDARNTRWCRRDVAQVQEVANYVAGQVEKVRSAAEAPSKLDTLILAALNIANDYFDVRRNRQVLIDDIDQRCKVLIEHIDDNI